MRLMAGIAISLPENLRHNELDGPNLERRPVSFPQVVHIRQTRPVNERPWMV